MEFFEGPERILMPLISLRGLVALPETILQFEVGRKKSIASVEKVMAEDQIVFLTAQADIEVDDPDFDDVYNIGTVARIKQVLKLPGENIRVLAEGLYRARICEAGQIKPFMTALVAPLPDDVTGFEPERAEAYKRTLRDTFDEYLDFAPKMSGDVLMRVLSEEDAGKLCDHITANIPLNYSDKQLVLECQNVEKRLLTVIKLLKREIQIWSIDKEIAEKLKNAIDENQRDYYIREQIKVMQEELGEGENNSAASDEYREKIKALKADDKVKEILFKEADKLSKMPFGAHEGTVVRSYLDLCLELPYNVFTKDKTSLKNAKAVLDKDHYGLEKVKERIVEFLAVRNIAPEIKGQIICLVGPPGVGKTSIASSIAKAMGRKFTRMSLGGVKDEAEIRGHRRTYIGAMPGRIINAIKNAGSMNPVILLDEIDKLGADYKGDPASALLEVLDPEQNKTFKDHFVEFEFDLSNVMFITTANSTETIPSALLDRMDVIELTSYTQEEKFHILKDYILPKQLKRHNLKKSNLSVEDKALETLITGYTKEAGVRNLERTLLKLLRKAAVNMCNGSKKTVVNKENLASLLGNPKFKPDSVFAENQIGIANGLAYTSVGGEMLFIEVNVMAGTGKLELTGSLGDIMKESAKAAVSYIRSVSDSLDIDPEFYKNKDIHIHVPEGAVPKDGPSAGITIATALISALTGRAVNRKVAMTGEITLRGRVLPIGGLKEKSMAAYKCGAKTVLIPYDNLGDIDEVDEAVKQAVKFIPVKTMDKVIELALEEAPLSKPLCNERKNKNNAVYTV